MAGAEWALKYLLKEQCAAGEGSPNEAGWAAEPNPQGSSVLSGLNLI